MPTLVIRHPDGSETEHPLEAELTLGRADGNDVKLAEGGVSRKHARFFLDGEDVQVEDVGSANGTFVDGERIDGPTVVAGASIVSVGDYQVSLKQKTKKPTRGAHKPTGVVPVVNRPSGPAALAKRTKPNRVAAPQLRGLTGPVEGEAFTLKGTLVVGRVAEADLQVDDDSVSRKHAEVEVRGRDVVLRDLGSANGTTVNGVPISEETLLEAGDIIQFGIVELIFETSAGNSGARAAAPLARASSAPVARRGAPRRAAGRDEPKPPAPGSSKRIKILAGVVVVFLVVLIAAKLMIKPPVVAPPGPGGTTKTKAPEPDLESLLTACRQYSSVESVSGPNWARAEEACKAALELEPIHPEANELMNKIRRGRVCDENLKSARSQVAAGRPEEALEFFLKVRTDCGYFLKALAEAKEPVEEVKKAAGKECKEYAAAGKWANALKRCEAYTRLACQLMDRDERQPPPLMKVKLDGPLGRNDWRPKDVLYLNFLKARERVTPGQPPWQCPDLPVFRPPQAGEDPAKRVKEEFIKRYPDPEMGRALGLYFDGKFQEMLIPLQKIQDNMQKAAFHDRARELGRNMSTAANQYQSGSTEVSNDKPEKAEGPFREALAIDEKLVMGDAPPPAKDDARHKELERRMSFVRRSIIDMMAKHTLEKGRGYADRHDDIKACAVWKLGMSFSRSNIDLLKALTNVCTKKASEKMKTAQTCEELKAVLKYAVDQDTFREKALAAMEEKGCEMQ